MDNKIELFNGPLDGLVIDDIARTSISFTYSRIGKDHKLNKEPSSPIAGEPRETYERTSMRCLCQNRVFKYVKTTSSQPII